MTRKHYRVIASDLKELAMPHMTASDYFELCNQMCISFKEDNRNFDRDKFMDAAEGWKS